MCRNIKTLFNFEPPVTDDEIRAASLQFVRKICGFSSEVEGILGSLLLTLNEKGCMNESEVHVRGKPKTLDNLRCSQSLGMIQAS